MVEFLFEIVTRCDRFAPRSYIAHLSLLVTSVILGGVYLVSLSTTFPAVILSSPNPVNAFVTLGFSLAKTNNPDIIKVNIDIGNVLDVVVEVLSQVKP